MALLGDVFFMIRKTTEMGYFLVETSFHRPSDGKPCAVGANRSDF
jgi:hypothetical protein